jgi:hypothetical protein
LRRALGGSGLALARLLLVENAIVIGAGAIAGVVAARWLLNIAVTLMPPSLLLLKPSTIDWRVVAFVALAAAVALSIVTAWSVHVALRTSTRGSVAGAAGDDGAHPVRWAGRGSSPVRSPSPWSWR